MADPTNEFYEIGAKYVTMAYDGTIVFDKTLPGGAAQVGKAVEMVSGGTVGLCATAHEIYGKLVKVEPDGFCSVQYKGFCDLPYDGSPTYAATNNGVVGGATAGNVAPASVAETATAVRRAIAIKADVTGRIIVELI